MSTGLLTKGKEELSTSELFDALTNSRKILELFAKSAKEVVEAETSQLVDMYADANPAYNAAKKVRDAARDELLTRLDGGEEDENSGYIRFRSDDTGRVVEFRPRVTATLNEQKTRAVLTSLNLLGQATRVEYRLIDAEKLKELVEEIQSMLSTLDPGKAQLLEVLLDEAVERQEVLDENTATGLVEVLVKQGKVPLAVAEEMYDVKTTYALYEAK